MPTQSNGSHPQSHHTPVSNGDHPLGTPTLPADNAPNDADFDALAELFLDPPEQHRPDAGAEQSRTPRAAHRLPVGALILGHLPVMASAWPTQHARMQAESAGLPVVIARLSRGVLTLEAVGADPTTPTFGDELDALDWATTHAQSALLRVDESDEPGLASAPGIDRLILLTGADDAAVVACYRKLKNLAADATAQRPLPATQLTVVGTGVAKGKLAHQRIARAARAFLDADLLEPVVIDRISPTQSRMLFNGPTTHTLGTLIEALRSGRCRADSEPVPAAETPPPQPIPQPPPPPTAHSTKSPAAPALDARPSSHPRPATIAFADEPAPAQVPGTGPLTSLVPGLLPLETTCPAAPEVAFAYDATGSLHLLAGSLVRLPECSTDTPIRSLLRANAWARAHATILARVEPRLAQSAATNAEMHLVTDRAQEARAVMDTPIHVHLAAPASPACQGLVTVSLDG